MSTVGKVQRWDTCSYCVDLVEGEREGWSKGKGLECIGGVIFEPLRKTYIFIVRDKHLSKERCCITDVYLLSEECLMHWLSMGVSTEEDRKEGSNQVKGHREVSDAICLPSISLEIISC